MREVTCDVRLCPSCDRGALVTCAKFNGVTTAGTAASNVVFERPIRAGRLSDWMSAGRPAPVCLPVLPVARDSMVGLRQWIYEMIEAARGRGMPLCVSC